MLVLAAVGAVAAWTAPDPSRPAAAFWRRYLTANAALTLAIFSAIPYKTPWNLLPFYAVTIVAAGIGVSALARATASRAAHVFLAGAVAIASAHLGWQAWRGSVVYASDPRNPYVYAQTVPDAVRMAARIRDLAALHPERERMPVTVIAAADEQWPLPWYLRTMTHVGYWTDASDAPDLTAPVIVSSTGSRGEARRHPRRSLCVRVLRAQARSPPDGLRRARPVGSFPVSCRDRRRWWRLSDGPAAGRRSAEPSFLRASRRPLGYICAERPAHRPVVSVMKEIVTMAKETTPPEVSRRQFVGTVATTAAGLTIVPRHVLGTGFQAPSDTVNVAIVGYANANAMGTNNLLNVAKTRQHRGALRLRRERGRQGRPGAARDDAGEVPEGDRLQRLPRDAGEAEGHRRGARRDARSHARRDRDGRDAARQARLRAEAADAHHQRGARADRGGTEVQGRDADGQSGPLRGGAAPDAGVVRGRRHRPGARGALLDQPPDLAAGHAAAGRGAAGAGRPGLGPVVRSGADAPVPQDLPPVRLARLAGLRRRRDGRHGVSRDGRGVDGPEARRTDQRRSRRSATTSCPRRRDSAASASACSTTTAILLRR